MIRAAISSGSPLLKPKSLNGQLVRALHDVLEDKTFNFDSKLAREAHEAAVLLLDRTMKEENFSTEFLRSLQERFDKYLKHLNPSSNNRERLWQ